MSNPYKILIIEDEISLLEALTDAFSRSGFVTLQAHNGVEGIKLALEMHPDFILLDLIMPLMDGVELLKKLRQDEWGVNARVLLLTNVNDQVVLSEALKEHTYDYLIKSDWKIDDIVKKVQERLEEK